MALMRQTAHFSFIFILALVSAKAALPMPDTGPPVQEPAPLDISEVQTWEEQKAGLHKRCLVDLNDHKIASEENPTLHNWRMWSYYIEKCKRLEARKAGVPANE
jgi:hypothetical protein